MNDILVGFIDKFDFADEKSHNQLSGHPKVGGVYQIIYKNDLYCIHIGHENTNVNLDGIVLGPELSGNYMDKWSFNVIPLTKDNFIDYPLSVEDMEKVAGWLDSDHKELRKLLNKNMNPVVIAELNQNGFPEGVTPEDQERIEEAVAKTLGKHFPVTKQLIQAVSENLNILVFHNPEMLEAVNEFLTYLSNQTLAYEQGTIRDQMSEEFLLFSKSKDTALYNAIDGLYAYTKDEAGDKEKLFRALQFQFLELQRRKLQDE